MKPNGSLPQRVRQPDYEEQTGYLQPTYFPDEEEPTGPIPIYDYGVDGGASEWVEAEPAEPLLSGDRGWEGQPASVGVASIPAFDPFVEDEETAFYARAGRSSVSALAAPVQSASPGVRRSWYLATLRFIGLSVWWGVVVFGLLALLICFVVGAVALGWALTF